MNGVDPVAPNREDVTVLSTEEMSVDDLAAWQAYERAARTDGANGAPTAAVVTGAETAELESQPLPSLHPRFTTRTISGRYRGTRGNWQLELRLDVDGSNTLSAVSGDFYRIAGGTTSYSGSFIAESVAVAVNRTSATITGTFEATFDTSFNRFQVTVPRVFQLQPRGDATIQFRNQQDQPGARYVCQFESPYFRTVQLEEDRMPSVTQFSSYDTSLLPAGGSGRTLSVVQAYGEAGIEILDTGGNDVVPDSEAAGDARPSWSNAELHASMVRHFSLWQDQPGWRVWLLHAQIHDLGERLLGIMFDEEGRQRQGAATFYARQAGASPAQLRSQLYTCVHELGHCFNLFHSFHKVHMTPPRQNRLNSLSWMNYPDRFPDGSAAFWSTFPFQFDREELIHLRHAFRDSIIMGGANFGVGAALQQGIPFRNLIQDNSGLRLDLSADASFVLGEPVSINLQLSTTNTRGKRINAQIHPNFGFVQIAIEKPNGQVVSYEPLLTQCIADEELLLDESRPSITASAYIGYGKRGHYFDQTGFYRVRALYYAPDGSEVLSNILPLRVRSPLNEADEEIADLYFGDDQGKLFTLLGSDAQELNRGNDAFALVQDKYPNHPLTDYARLVTGNNAARQFKLITPENQLTVRPSHIEEAQAILGSEGMTGLEAMASARGGGNALFQQLQARAVAKSQGEIGGGPSAWTALESMASRAEQPLSTHIATFCVAQTQEVAKEFAGIASEPAAESGADGDPTAAAAPSKRRSRRK